MTEKRRVEKNKKRILIVCQHFWPESFRVNDIADYFIEQNNDVDVLCGIPNYPEGKFFSGYSAFSNRKQIHRNISIRRVLEIPRGKNTNLRIFLNYISFPFFSLFHIPRLLLKQYDKIFLYQLSPVMMSVTGIIIGKIKQTETTMYILDPWPENLFSVIKISNPLLRRIVTSSSHWHYRHVDKLIVLSDQMRKHLIETIGTKPERITVIPQAPEKIYERPVQDKEISNRFRFGFNILYTGNISPAQSFDTIIQAAKILKQRKINDINWIIVGDGMSRKEVELKIQQEGLGDIFHFEGQKPIEDIPRYNYSADLLIGCLVKSEFLEATIPAKVTSYIASGKPIVLAMDGEVQSLINNTIRCGHVGPTEDSEALADNIERIYKLPQKDRDKLGSRAKEYYLHNLERNIVLEKLLDFIYT